MKQRLNRQIILLSIGASLLLSTQFLSARDGLRERPRDFTPQQRGDNPNNRFNPRNNNPRRNNNNNQIDSNETNSAEKIALGGALFNDTSLSLTKTQSCASCHNPTQAFTDNRENSVHKSVSVGDDGVSLGDRNAPMVTYSAFSPAFSATRNGFRGGQFWNGSAKNLTEQAKAPFLNPVEMQMPDAQSVVARVSENSSYIEQLQAIYGENILENEEEAFTAIANAIASFEKSSAFATFDSKFDKSRARTATLTEQERLGQQLFRQNRCVRCHHDRGREPLFTNFRYINLGIPKNSEVRVANGKDADFVDHGLLDNPNVTGNRADGRFKVPSLRNVAVTAPYMHNGKFKNLKTVVHFYNTRDVAGAINPETSLPWEASEVEANKVTRNRIGNLGLSDSEEDAIVAFLKTLTDERYESVVLP